MSISFHYHHPFQRPSKSKLHVKLHFQTSKIIHQPTTDGVWQGIHFHMSWVTLKSDFLLYSDEVLAFSG